MTYRKAMVESALGANGRNQWVHRCVVREFPGDPDPEIGRLIKATAWWPGNKGHRQAAHVRTEWNRQIDVAPELRGRIK